MSRVDDFPGFLDEEALKDETFKNAQTKAEQVLLKERKRRKESGEPPLRANDEAIVILGTMFVEASKDLIRRAARLEIASGKAPASKG